MSEPEQPRSPFDELIGTDWGESGPEAATARLRVRDELTQPYGLVHGGVLTTLAESVTSRASNRALAPEGMVAIGQANSTTFLRPVTGGHVEARAERIHGGRTTWVWDVEMRDDEGRLCAVSRVTIAIRERRGEGRPGA